MIRLYDFDEVRPEEILNRDIRAEADVEATVDAIIADVRARGDAALIEYAAKFDHAELTDVRVSQEEIDEAFAELEKTDDPGGQGRQGEPRHSGGGGHCGY